MSQCHCTVIKHNFGVLGGNEENGFLLVKLSETVDPMSRNLESQIEVKYYIYEEVLTKTRNKTSTLGNKLLLWCIHFYVEVSIG